MRNKETAFFNNMEIFEAVLLSEISQRKTNIA